MEVDSIVSVIWSPVANELILLPIKSVSTLAVVSFIIVVLPIDVWFWFISTVILAFWLVEHEK